MAIKGSLKEASLADVLQLLSMGAKTGCLSVTDRANFGYIYFDQGRITYASIVNRPDRLGDLLLKEGKITREQLDEAIRQQSTQRGKRFGEILVERGWIEPAVVERYVRRQIEEAVLHLFTWNQGSFYFEPSQKPEGEPFLVSLSAESLLLEGARRVDEWSLVEKKIPSLDLIFSVDRDYVEASGAELTDEQKAILPYLDGRRSLREIIDEAGRSEFDVGKAVYGLISAGFAHRVGRRQPGADVVQRRARVDEHWNLGVAFYRAGMYDEAIREFRRVADLQPDGLDAPFFLGLVAVRQGALREAARHFAEVLNRGGRRAAVFNNLAVVLELLGKPREALAVLQKAAQQGVKDPRLELTRAHLLLKTGDARGVLAALEAYARAVPEERRPALYYAMSALTLALLGRLPEAARRAEEGLRRFPRSAPLLNNLGVLYEWRGDDEKARELFRRASEEDASLSQAQRNEGDLLYRQGAYDQAAEVYERVLAAKPPRSDEVYARLGNIYYRRRDRARALEMWEKALALNPRNEVVRTNLEIVRGAAQAT